MQNPRKPTLFLSSINYCSTLRAFGASFVCIYREARKVFVIYYNSTLPHAPLSLHLLAHVCVMLNYLLYIIIIDAHAFVITADCSERVMKNRLHYLQKTISFFKVFVHSSKVNKHSKTEIIRFAKIVFI